MNDGMFLALLKTLSSEEVIKHDLQLLAQISSCLEEGYFKSFIMSTSLNYSVLIGSYLEHVGASSFGSCASI